MNIIHVSAIALIDSDGRILLAERPQGKAMGGMWEFPGGKIEVGETPEQALIRELQEELAIDVSHTCLTPVSFVSHSYTNTPPAKGEGGEHECPCCGPFVSAAELGLRHEFHLVMYLFACRKWKGTPHPQEGQRLKWIKPADMKSLSMPPADIPLVASLLNLL